MDTLRHINERMDTLGHINEKIFKETKCTNRRGACPHCHENIVKHLLSTSNK